MKPKYPYNSEEIAKLFIKERNLENYEAYKCPICHKWHIGHIKE